MTQFSFFGVNGNGTTGPGASTSFGAGFVAGLAFKVTSSGQVLSGYYVWRADSAQSASCSCALWILSAAGAGTFQAGTSASASAMVAGQWNFIPLAVPFALATGNVYKVVLGLTGNFNDVHSQFGTGGPYAGGIINGPITAYSAPVGQGGTNESPFTNTFQGSFGTSGADPTTNLPSSDDSQANFFVDILVGPPVAPSVASSGLNQAIRAKRQFNYPRAGSISAEIKPGTGNISGPVQGAGFGNGMGASGAPVRNPVQGPVFRSLHWPVQAQDPLAQQRISGRPGPKGRVYGLSRGAPVRNPSRGPVFRPDTSWLTQRAPVSLNAPRGRTYSNQGAPVHNPSPAGTGPALHPFTSPVRIHPSLPPKGRIAANPGALVRNPQSGGVLAPAGQPAGRVVVIVRTGLAMSSVIPPPAAPSTSGPAFLPLAQARKAPQPLPGRGRTYSGNGTPARNPSQGPVFRPDTVQYAQRPAFPLPPKGRSYSNSGAPVRNPSTGPVFIPDTRVQAQRPSAAPPLRGRISSNPGIKAFFSPPGPVFTQAGSPFRARILPPGRGRVNSGSGGPVQNPPPPVIGPVFRQATSPDRIRPSLPIRGRVSSGSGTAARNPQHGVTFPALQGPVRAHVLQVFSKGRISSSSGAPVRNPVFPSPLYPLKTPVRAVFPLPARGRTGSNPGGPVVNPVTHLGPPFYPLRFPARTRIIPPLRGRISSNPGGAVRNPHQGTRFIPAVHPIRALIPQNAPRGRIASGPGGPVENIPFALILFRQGLPGRGWHTGTPSSGNVLIGVAAAQPGWNSGSALISGL